MAVNDILRQIQTIDTKIENAQREKARQEGALQNMLEQLKKDFGCTPKDIDKLIRTETKKRGDFEENLQKQWKELNEAFAWWDG